MIYTKQFAMACTLTAAILWSACSLLVSLMPQGMMQMTAHMFHADLTQMTWTLTWSGFCIGLASWSVISGITGALLAVTYNRLSTSENQ